MKAGSRSPIVVAAGLLVLIAVLATLQYRWLGQVSAAERERMTTTLGAHASAFTQDFDREITRAYLTFQLDPLAQAGNVASHLAQRYDRWQATSRYPRLIGQIYIVPRADAAGLSLRRFDAATRFVEPVAWPDELAPVREALARPSTVETKPGGPAIVTRTLPTMVWEAVPAIVVPAPVVMFGPRGVRAPGPEDAGGLGYVILVLDRTFIAKEMLPALAQQHFRVADGGTSYEMAVVSTAGGDPLYASSRSFTPDPATPSDAASDLLQVRTQEFGAMVSEVRRFTSFVSSRVESGGAAGAETRVAIREAPYSLVLQHAEGIDRRAVESGLVATPGRTVAPASRWRLLVRHPSGSLETAVGQVRRRNLLVSSGILAVLGVSIGFLVVSTRRAQELARQQMEFVAAVSHELRTPLAVIRSAADNLAEGVVHDEPQVRRYGRLVRGEGRRLSEMVEQILELAGIHSGQRGFALHAVPVAPLLRDVLDASGTLIEEAGLTVTFDAPDTLPPVAGDEQALRRVFQNLVGNAIKYGASGGWIGIAARATGRDVLVTVADRGMGIAPSEREKIFDPFYRAPEVVAAQIHGAGLGLNLVQRIVEAHGGRVEVTSTPDEGSTFTVRLPAASGQPDARPSGAGAPAPGLPDGSSA